MRDKLSLRLVLPWIIFFMFFFVVWKIRPIRTMDDLVGFLGVAVGLALFWGVLAVAVWLGIGFWESCREVALRKASTKDAKSGRSK